MAAPELAHQGIGPQLRAWRRRRRLSQLELALDAGISPRHLSFVETHRSKPSADMVLRLAEHLDVPLRERNRLLLAAGYAPRYGERSFDDPELRPVRAAVQQVLDAQDPFPVVVVDHHWELVAHNRGAELLLAGLPADLVEPPLNVLRATLHPAGLAPRIRNLHEWRAHLLERVARQAATSGDPALSSLLEELAGYHVDEPAAAEQQRSDARYLVAVPLVIEAAGETLSFFSTVTTFGTPVDITVEELAIESFFPADDVTATALRRHAAAGG